MEHNTAPNRHERCGAKVGDKITFNEERMSYTIRACNERYAVCTKPFNPRRTVLYTIVDFENNIRGTENFIFGMGAETKQDCEEMLKRLISGETEISHRNRISLNIKPESGRGGR